MSWRRLRVLIEHLPPESATMTALRNATPADELERLSRRAKPERGRWSHLEQLVALLVDVQQEHTHAFLLANHGGNGPKPRRPEPIRRPGVAREEKPKRDLAPAQAEWLFALING